ncbi:SPOR domain-containing protein [Thiocapsa roseopersicina]|uniref:Sporulation related domain-containing protein n=1 Tax=Thiocapsa roseopersicina TaxID=1058 RepID=A0A1H2X9U7_THIRO|nr:SPOR domain-containing protein [Thiocapsa roseopersicina]SDW89536.1 Sporulation related domain-containing protein [Thiocapsa roseopersicina]
MSTDFRRAGLARATPRRGKQSHSCLWSFLLGGMLGAFGVGLYWTQNPDAMQTPPTALPAKVERPAATPPSFEFPNLLRDTEVDIAPPPPPPPAAPRPEPRIEVEPRTAVETVQPAAVAAPAVPTSTTGRGFLVQVGSFRRAGDAERLKAELALLGITSRVEVATIPSGETYHRVRTGPYADQAAVDKVRGLLKRNGKDAMTIPIK